METKRKIYPNVVYSKWLKYFSIIDVETRNNALDKYRINKSDFITMVREVYEDANVETGDLDDELKKIRQQINRPRIGKKSKLFLLRHYEIADELRKKGASYKEIAYYLKKYRRFSVNASYLKQMMERLA